MKTGRALARLPPGARLSVRATDPMSAIDIPHAVTTAGGRLLSMERDGRELVFQIER